MSRNVMNDFAASGRVADMDRVLQVEVSRELGKVVRVMVHIVSVRSLRRPAVTASIVSDHAVAVVQEEHDLRIPVVR